MNYCTADDIAARIDRLIYNRYSFPVCTGRETVRQHKFGRWYSIGWLEYGNYRPMFDVYAGKTTYGEFTELVCEVIRKYEI